MIYQHTKQYGFTMVEMLIAMTLTAILLNGLVEIVTVSHQTNRIQQSLGELQRKGRLSIDYLRMDMRRAGFAGCLPGGIREAENQLINSLKADYASALIEDPANQQVFDDNYPELNSDSLRINGALGEGAQLFSPMTNVSANIELRQNSQIKKGDVVVISNCEGGDLFHVVKILDGSGSEKNSCEAAGEPCVLVHCTGGGCAGSKNQSGTLSQLYGADARVFALESRIYSIFQQTGQENQLQVTGAASGALVEGVENMQVLYGEDTDGDDIANYYVPLDEVIDIKLVVSIKLNLLLRSSFDFLSAEAAQYQFEGQLHTAPDKRMRKTFSTTIALRNKLR